MKRLLQNMIVIVMAISLFDVVVYAENIDLSYSDYTISDSGEYNIIGNGLETTHKIIIDDNAGDVTLTITDLNINADDGPAIKIGNGSSLNLILNGENYLKGSKGYAAISVSAFFNGNVYDPDGSGKVIISGNGSLEAIGGDAKENCGAGAGIGGDGFNGISGSDFGVIQFIEGEIKARGGTAFGEMDLWSTAGAGAGIGSGGVIGTDDWISAGKIVIDGAKVKSIGGEGYGVYYCGAAAGIGSGGGDSNGQAIYATDLSIEIKSGKVEAKACEDFDSYYGAAAGVGGASNGTNGEIIISGGTVYAYGGNSPENFSGAAIGSGDNAGGYKISIKGDAIVYAYAKDGGAAIGGGCNGYGDIEIVDSASVYAYGGQYATGIGSGSSPRYGNDSNVSNITLDSTGVIIAYGGKNANAIGLGSTSNLVKCNITIGKNTKEIRLFTNHGQYSPIPGISLENELDDNHNIEIVGDESIYWNDISNDTYETIYSFDGETIVESGLNWETDDNEIRLMSNGMKLMSIPYDDEYRESNHNWMLISDDLNGEESDDPSGPEEDKPEYPNKPDIDIDNGYDSSNVDHDSCRRLFGSGWVWSEDYKACIRKEWIIVDTSTK